MKTFKNQGAQGDVLFIRINDLPQGLVRETGNGDNNGKIVGNDTYIVAHSETGHHHVMEQENVEFYSAANDEFALYAVVSEPTVLFHERSFDTHESLRVDPGTYKIVRQREYTAEGFRRAAD